MCGQAAPGGGTHPAVTFDAQLCLELNKTPHVAADHRLLPFLLSKGFSKNNPVWFSFFLGDLNDCSLRLFWRMKGLQGDS